MNDDDTLMMRARDAHVRIVRLLESLQPAALLAARLYVAKVFLFSGLTKIHDWSATLALFQDEYQVPVLPPALAAWLATGGELLLPVLLVFGLCGRFAAAGLLVLNIVAAYSLMDIADAALQQHEFWGSLLVAVLLWGPGAWSLDRLGLAYFRRAQGGAAAQSQ